MPSPLWFWCNTVFRRRPARSRPPRVCRLRLEPLAHRTLLAVFDVQGGTASYLASAHVANQVLVAQIANVIELIDTGEPITLTDAARQAGCVGAGTNAVLCPAAVLTRVSLDTGDGHDSVVI